MRNATVFASVVGLLMTLAAQSAPLQTGDGLRLGLSPGGRVTNLTIGRTVLPLKGEGGFAVADFKHQPEPINLVPNAGFEEGTKGWSLEASQARDTTVAHSGTASIRLTVPGPQPANSNLQVIVPVKPLTHYRVGMWERRHECPTRSGGAPGAYSSELDAQGNHVGVFQVGGRVPTQDDLWAPVSWGVYTRADTRQLLLRGDLYQTTGTVWLDDFFVYENSGGVYQPVSGELVPTADGAIFKGALPQDGVSVEARFRSDRECVRVEGTVTDTTGSDRALGLRFALPLDLLGWRWYGDAEDRATIEAAGTYERTCDCEAGRGRCSTYPWSAVSAPQAGLSLALPLSQGPRVFVISHNQRVPELSLTFFFGLSAQAGHNPGKAPFSFVIYSHDPAWGMRSAMERYYRLFPESFVKRPTYEGYLNYANLERFVPETHELNVGSVRLADANDFGEGYKFVWHLHGCYDYHQIASDDPKMPTDQTVLSWLAQQVEAEKTKPGYYTPTADTIKKLVYDGNGLIRYIFDTQYWRAHEGYNGTDKPGWGLNFRVNEDPDISGFLAGRTRQEVEKFSAANPVRQPYDSCFTADAIEGYSGLEAGLDYRTEHFKTTLTPLTFGAGSLRPAISNTIWDFHQKVWRPLTQQHQVITYGNGNVESCFFTMPFTDLAMVEGRWPEARRGQEERFWRATAYHKIWRYWVDHTGWYYTPADRASVTRQLRHGLAGAIFPSVEAVQSSSHDLDAYRDLYRQYVPAIEELSAAGWEPVPYATATEGVVVERFGSYSDGGLHLTLRSYAKEPQSVVLQLDRKGLGIAPSADLVYTDLLPGTATVAAFPRVGLAVTLEADGTRAFWVGTRRRAAQRGFALALYTLGKIERTFGTELDPASTKTLQAATATARRGLKATDKDALALAEQLQTAAGAIEADLKTKSPVDLAKLLYRLRTQVSLAPVALLGVQSEARRVVQNTLPGEVLAVVWEQAEPPALKLIGKTVAVLSPWAAVSTQCQATLTGRAQLFVPPAPERQLLPYLLLCRAKARGTPVTIATPVDVTVGQAVQVALEPAQATRGADSNLKLIVTNRLNEPATVRLSCSAPRLCKLTPAEVALDLPAGGRAEANATLSVETGVALGHLWLPYTVKSDTARFNGAGVVSVKVVPPGP